MISSPLLVRRLYPLTAAAAAAAALTATIMVLREQGDGWQLFAVLLIATLLGETLAPILDRYSASQERPQTRVLGDVGGVVARFAVALLDEQPAALLVAPLGPAPPQLHQRESPL